MFYAQSNIRIQGGFEKGLVSSGWSFQLCQYIQVCLLFSACLWCSCGYIHCAVVIFLHSVEKRYSKTQLLLLLYPLSKLLGSADRFCCKVIITLIGVYRGKMSLVFKRADVYREKSWQERLKSKRTGVCVCVCMYVCMYIGKVWGGGVGGQFVYVNIVFLCRFCCCCCLLLLFCIQRNILVEKTAAQKNNCTQKVVIAKTEMTWREVD